MHLGEPAVPHVREGTVSDMDFGDWLMMQGKLDQETYEKKQEEARELLEV